MPYADKGVRISYYRSHRKEWDEKGLCTRCGGPHHPEIRRPINKTSRK